MDLLLLDSMFTLFINFKTYTQGTGERAVKLARICEEAGNKSSIEIIPVVQVVDLKQVRQSVKIPVWIQHLDWQKQGKYSGWVNLEAAVEAGGRGTLLNHSEHQIPPGTIKQTIERIRGLGEIESAGKFETMVCCKTLGQMERLVKYKPDYLAYEISELIGGEVSITAYNPKAIKHAVEICGEIPLVVGAGINKGEDIKTAKILGAKGVLVSSAVVLAKDPEDTLLELVELLK